MVVADDEPGLRELLVLLIGRDERFRVVAETGDGLQALAAVDTHDPDLLLLDLGMPHLDGLEVLQRLSERPRPATVVLTGFTDPDVHRQAVELGAYACLVKGLDFGRLLATLEQAAEPQAPSAEA